MHGVTQTFSGRERQNEAFSMRAKEQEEKEEEKLVVRKDSPEEGQTEAHILHTHTHTETAVVARERKRKEGIERALFAFASSSSSFPPAEVTMEEEGREGLPLLHECSSSSSSEQQ